MRNIISLAHISLDGFMTDANGNMDFVAYNDELADHSYPLMKPVDLAVYGRVTYELMESYWPTVGDAPDANAPTKNHARWYANVKKIVASRTITSSKPNVRVVGDDIVGALRDEKQKPGGDIMIFGSPMLTRALEAAGLVDEWRLSVTPVILGGGKSLFGALEKRTLLQLVSTKTFTTGVIAVHYTTKR
ncbi:MAG: dihydrofolate reductase family protein [Kofleriaceae bacterium]